MAVASRRIQTEVLVIGGGATGLGTAWDLALRGFDTVLVERADLIEGTSGRFHGLLHSGGRYVVKDPVAAKECVDENALLRRLIPDCIEDTGGLFVETPDDDPEYADRFLEGCRASSLPVEEISVAEALRREPRLNPQIRRAFAVPDASIDAWKTASSLARGATAEGARVLTYHRVVDLHRDDGAMTGARVRDERSGEEFDIEARFILNASGPWAAQILHMAGIEDVGVIPGKGIMIAMNHRLVNTVINRCVMPADGDILVPIRTVSVIGTTDIRAADPDELEVTQDEVDQMLEDGERLVPGFKQARALRVWAGARPLFQDARAGEVADTRDVSRTHAVVDHAARDGVKGLLTMSGGKLTTFRLMAQDLVDAMCDQLGEQRPCRTEEVKPPGNEDGEYYDIGSRLRRRERTMAEDELICECELIGRKRLEEELVRRWTTNLDDIRRLLRLGDGPVPGRLLHLPGDRDHARGRAARRRAGSAVAASLPPGALEGRVADPLRRSAAPGAAGRLDLPRPAGHRASARGDGVNQHDVLVVGTGLAGLSAAVRLAQSGARVRVLAKGVGATHLAGGTIDVLGYAPERVERPGEALAALPSGHPYTRVGAARVAAALDWFKTQFSGGYTYTGSLEENLLLPTAIGVPKPTALAPVTMAGGDLRSVTEVMAVGFRGLKDFHPALLADGLSRTLPSVTARATELHLPVEGRVEFNALGLARAFDQRDFRRTVIAELTSRLRPGEVVAFPAALGIASPHDVWSELEHGLGRPVFEVPTLPPSVPGMRVFAVLHDALRRAGGSLLLNNVVVGAERSNGRVSSLRVRVGLREERHGADWIVIATGGFASGGLALDSDWTARETALGLPVAGVPEPGARRFEPQYFAAHPIARAGVAVDDRLRPVGADGFENVLVAGATLAGAEPWKEKSGDGLSLSTGHMAAELVLAESGATKEAIA